MRNAVPCHCLPRSAGVAAEWWLLCLSSGEVCRRLSADEYEGEAV